MRKLSLQMQLSVDGFVASPDGSMDWAVWNWDNALKSYVGDLTAPVDLILLGRKLAEGFIPHWAAVAADPLHPEHEAGKKFDNTEKVVFSRKLQQSEWANTRIVNEANTAGIRRLKQSGGGDIMVYGGASFVSSLIHQNLIDEYHLFINPAAIGQGLTIFSDLQNRRNLRLISSRSYDCGITVLVYQPA